ncbi:hypothetical protein Q1695_016129 [Nippostrongylus brasiliensis]|nr:hypothetical protein Q1695_016129 [Nippostrongylus brasiliensis]
MANTDDLLLIGLKRYGRRIMVQSLIKKSDYSDQINSKLVERAKNGVFWLQMDPLARHLQFLTNEFDRDFNYIGAFDIRGKVIIYGHVESRIRFYELIIQRQTSTFEPGTDDTTLSVQLLRRRKKILAVYT